MKLVMIFESRNKAGCVVVDHGNVLLIKKGNNWQLPKGRIRNRETLSQAAVRETAEETGIIPTLAKASPFPLGSVEFFLATGSGKLKPSKKEGISKCRWMPLRNALRKIIPEHAPVLKHFSDYMQK